MEFTNETWVSCNFSQSGLDGSSELVKEDYAELSFVQCIVLAMALDWAYLVILGATRGCSLYEINAYVVGAVTKDSIGGDSRCKTPDRIVGCGNSTHFYPVGHVLEAKTICGVLHRENICIDEGIFEWQETAPPPPQLTTCDPPFEQVDSVGCIFIKYCWLKLHDNEPVCQHMGAKMASPKTLADFTALQNHLLAEAQPNAQFHAGAEYSEAEGHWVWKYHGRMIDPNEWRSVPTATVGGLEMATWSNFNVKYRGDDKLKNLLCMADL